MKTLDLDYVRSRLTYNSKTGILTWAPGTRFAGKPAGGVVGNGYIMIPMMESGKKLAFYAHRLAFALHHSRWPEAEIDHIDGDRTNNRIKNLREATRIQNAANSIAIGMNKRGVTYRPRKKRWTAQISFANHNVYLGLYDTEAEAHAAFAGAATVLRKEFLNLTNQK